MLGHRSPVSYIGKSSLWELSQLSFSVLCYYDTSFPLIHLPALLCSVFFSSSMRNFWVKAEKIFILKFQIRELQLIETASAVTACALKIDKICQYVNQLISVRFTKTPWLEIVWFFFFDFPRCPAGFPCYCKVASVGLEVEAVHWLASRAWASRSWALTKEGENNWMIKKKRGPVAIC